MQKLNNFEKVLYPQLKERSDRLREKNRILEEENTRLREENRQIETLQLQLEELRAMKFGKKRDNKKISTKSLPKIDIDNADEVKEKRTAESYRRPEPAVASITEVLPMPIATCPDCGADLVEKKEHIHYREDLYEVENLLKSAQKIVKTIVESGKCLSCGKRQYAMEIPKQKVTIGQNVRIMVVHLIIVQGMSYSEAIKNLKNIFGINISSGEIANILEGESRLLTSYYDDLFTKLKKEAAHYDETGWGTEEKDGKISLGNYCWVKIGVESQNQIFWFGKSRGLGVAEQLRGEKSGSIGASDDYGCYRTLFDYHQLCWAHPHRKLRDLAESGCLSGKALKACQRAYHDFADVYKKARNTRLLLLGNTLSDEQKISERLKLEELFKQLFEPSPHDPEKLKNIRKSLEKRKNDYFTFFDYPILPLDNNKAERALRKIVLKRKKSFACRSQRSANVLSILYSVVFTLVESNPGKNFFQLYGDVIEDEIKRQ